ncbi:FAD-dependent oxidoreductase [Paraburkholderia sabiae]|uniref:FAD-dependent oxidoreductase n=1 Tax=Paraburkholderia sabiae TaxID=273251 RepID=UPI001A0205C4|nr:hypothetical protein LMG24235_08612 [Paraburkholderia sabiae]
MKSLGKSTIADYVDSYYSRTLRRDNARPSVNTEVNVDVCIVGAGMAGITAALELLHRGRSVALLGAKPEHDGDWRSCDCRGHYTGVRTLPVVRGTWAVPWNGSYVGLAVAQLTYWSYQMMDFMREPAA